MGRKSAYLNATVACAGIAARCTTRARDGLLNRVPRKGDDLYSQSSQFHLPASALQEDSLATQAKNKWRMTYAASTGEP